MEIKKYLRVVGLLLFLYVISKIDLRTLEPSKITIIITKKSAEEMKLKPGDSINVIIKPTEIIIKNIIE